MSPRLSLIVILNFLGAMQSLLLACALFSAKRGNRTVNRLLAAFAATVAISIAGVALSVAGYSQAFPLLRKLHQPFYFLGAPLLFLYVRALVSREPVFKRRDLLHFIPAALCALYLVPYYLQSPADKLNSASPFYGVEWFTVRSGLLILQFLIYLGLIARTLLNYRQKAEGRGAARTKAVLFQIRFLLVAFLALWAVGVADYMANLLSAAYYNTPETDLIVPLGLTIFVYALTYLSLRRPEALADGVEHAPASKYEKSSLTPERYERYVSRLLHFMETERPFTDGDLTLPKLAEKVSIPERHLSRIINERLNQNFADFVNTYRVEEAKRRLTDASKKHYSVLAIAEEVGFNSKSSFNSVFKKQTNMTPSEFRKASNGNGSH